ncbi:alpha/beta fold hydrolase [Saliphagus sp. LR7]|uniref:alpha/beta fold hydrolase n=1 Tax=Saliphagus sp. LR7 TaxID=2282654 RepID=UPI001E4F841F|nr:alpha/beta hydrolase [Saliphagus sp. LR7]
MDTVTSADGTEIAFERTGNGPPLVLVYGNSDVHEFWDDGSVRPALAEHHTVYTIERRGRGESGDATEYELEREAEDVAAVVDSIDEPVTLLGHSGGALYSLEAALRTDNLHALILYEPPIQADDHELDVEDAVVEMERLLADGENEQAIVLFQRDVAGITPEEIDDLRSSPIWQDMVDAAHALPRELQAISEYEFEAGRFADVTTPTLLLTGTESPQLYKDATVTVNDALPNGRTTSFEGEQHMAMHTAPDRFVDKVRTFSRGSS